MPNYLAKRGLVIIRLSGTLASLNSSAIEESLASLEGVEGSEVNAVAGTVRVEFDPEKTGIDEIRARISSLVR